MMLPLVDETKRSSDWREVEICIQRRKASIRTKLFLDFFFKTFSMKNEVFKIVS